MTDFVHLVEVNDNEGETWTWWLQLDGNNEQLDRLATLLASCAADVDDLDDLPFALHLDDVEPETIVDKLVQYAESGYFSSHNKVVGAFTCPDSLGYYADALYKGRIRDFFTALLDTTGGGE
jgi:hypothetical protein